MLHNTKYYNLCKLYNSFIYYECRDSFPFINWIFSKSLNQFLIDTFKILEILDLRTIIINSGIKIHKSILNMLIINNYFVIMK